MKSLWQGNGERHLLPCLSTNMLRTRIIESRKVLPTHFDLKVSHSRAGQVVSVLKLSAGHQGEEEG